MPLVKKLRSLFVCLFVYSIGQNIYGNFVYIPQVKIKLFLRLKDKMDSNYLIVKLK
jgi:hypothetical protein